MTIKALAEEILKLSPEDRGHLNIVLEVMAPARRGPKPGKRGPYKKKKALDKAFPKAKVRKPKVKPVETDETTGEG